MANSYSLNEYGDEFGFQEQNVGGNKILPAVSEEENPFTGSGKKVD